MWMTVPSSDTHVLSLSFPVRRVRPAAVVGGNGKNSETWCWTFYLNLLEKDRKSDEEDGQ